MLGRPAEEPIRAIRPRPVVRLLRPVAESAQDRCLFNKDARPGFGADWTRFVKNLESYMGVDFDQGGRGDPTTYWFRVDGYNFIRPHLFKSGRIKFCPSTFISEWTDKILSVHSVGNVFIATLLPCESRPPMPKDSSANVRFGRLPAVPSPRS